MQRVAQSDNQSQVKSPPEALATLVKLAAHPLAELFPLDAIHFQDLCSDIQQHGLINPIVRHDGLILDGRNRVRACEKLGIAPTFIQFDALNLNCTPEEYIWSQNMARRHLTDDQRAAIVLQWGDRIEADARKRQAHGKTAPGKTLVAKTPQASKVGKTRDKLAEMAQVAAHKIRTADTIKKASPSLLQKVANGELKLRDATRKVAMQARRQRAASDARAESNSSGRPEWTVWGLEAGSGPDVLPLEVLWRSTQKELEDISEKITDAFRKPTGFRPYTVGYLPSAPKASEQPDVMAVPGVAEAFQELERVTKELTELFQRALEPVAERFRQLALRAPNTKVPLGADTDEQRKSFLAVNASQKNGRGRCGLPGCWNTIEAGAQCCSEHTQPEELETGGINTPFGEAPQ